MDDLDGLVIQYITAHDTNLIDIYSSTFFPMILFSFRFCVIASLCVFKMGAKWFQDDVSISTTVEPDRELCCGPITIP
jgi:hypothetical protein